MPHPKLDKIIEPLKTAFIFLLAVIMLVLMLLIMLGQNNNPAAALPLENRMFVYEAGAAPTPHYGMDTTRISPTLLAYRSGNGGKGLRCITASSALPRVYAAIFPLLRMIFCADAACMTLTGTEAATVWEETRSTSGLIYVVYPDALPSAVIALYTYAEINADMPQITSDSAYGKELLITETASGDISAAFRDVDGTVTVYTAKEDTGSEDDGNHLSLSAYIETVGKLAQTTVSAVFAADLSSVFPAEEAVYTVLGTVEDGTDTALVFEDEFSLAVYRCNTGIDDTIFASDSALLPQILKTVGMRMRDADAENYYIDRDGGRVYLNADGRLTFEASGDIHYTALQNDGIKIASFLGYSNIGGDYSLSEYLQASDKLVDILRSWQAELCGLGRELQRTDAADLVLRSVYTEQGSVSAGYPAITVSYTCSIGGVPLLQADGTLVSAASVTLSGGTVISFSIHTMFLETTGEKEYLLPQHVTLRAMAYEHPTQTPTQGILQMGYLLSEEETVARAEWLFRSKPSVSPASDNHAPMQRSRRK